MGTADYTQNPVWGLKAPLTGTTLMDVATESLDYGATRAYARPKA